MLEKTCSYEDCDEVIYYDRNSRENKKPKLCPKCGRPYWDKPGQERVLFLIQDKLDNHPEMKQSILAELYDELTLYAKNIVLSLIRSKVTYSESKLMERASDSASEVIMYYLRNNDYRIHTSFSGLLTPVVKSFVYAPDELKSDKELSLDVEMDSDSGHSYLEYIGTAKLNEKEIERMHSFDPIHENTKETGIFNKVEKIIKHSSEIIHNNFSERDALLFLVGLDIRLKEGNKRGYSKLEKFYSQNPPTVRKNIYSMELLLFDTIKEESYV